MTSNTSKKTTNENAKKPPKSGAERQAEYRARKRAEGLQAKTTWVKDPNSSGYLKSDTIYLEHIPLHRRKTG